MSKGIFRKVSTESVASAQELDSLNESQRSRRLILIGTHALLALVAISWAVFGSIPVTVAGRGVIYSEEAITGVRAQTRGVVAKINAIAGDEVKKGDLLAVLENPTLHIEASSQKNVVKALQAEIKSEQDLRKARVEFQQMFLGMKRAKLESIKREFERAKEFDALHLSKIEKALSEQRFMIKSQEEKIAILQNQADPTSALKLAYIGQMGKLEILEKQVENLQVHSQVDGKVVEVNATKEIGVNPGETLFWIQPQLKEDETMQVHAYFPAKEAKRIKKGMYAEMSFDQGEEFLGRVVDVCPLLVTEDAQKAIPSQSIKESLGQGEGYSLVKIQPIEEQLSEYGFSEETNPSLEIDPGALGQVRILVERKSPISLLLSY